MHTHVHPQVLLTCTCVCSHIYTRSCAHMSMHTEVCAYMYTHALTHVRSHVHQVHAHMHAHRSELMCMHMHSYVHPIYTHVHAYTCMPTEVSSCVYICTPCALSYTPMCMHIQACPQMCTQVYPCAHFHVCTLMYTKYACTQMHDHRCALTCTHSHTCTLLCTLPLLFMAHGSVSTPLSWPRDKRRVLQEPSTHHSRGNKEAPSPSTSRHLQSALPQRGHSHTQVLPTPSFFSMPSSPWLLLLFSCSVVSDSLRPHGL